MPICYCPSRHEIQQIQLYISIFEMFAYNNFNLYMRTKALLAIALLIISASAVSLNLNGCKSKRTNTTVTIGCPLKNGVSAQKYQWQYTDLPDGWSSRNDKLVAKRSSVRNEELYGARLSLLDRETGEPVLQRTIFYIFNNGVLQSVGQTDFNFGIDTIQTSVFNSPSTISSSSNFNSGSNTNTVNAGFITNSNSNSGSSSGSGNSLFGSASGTGGLINNLLGAKLGLLGLSGGSNGAGNGGLLGIFGGGNGGGLLQGLVGGGLGSSSISGSGSGSISGSTSSSSGSNSGGGILGGLFGGNGGGLLGSITNIYQNLFSSLGLNGILGGGSNTNGQGLLNGWANLFGGGKRRLLTLGLNGGLMGLFSNPFTGLLSGMSGIGGGAGLLGIGSQILGLKGNLINGLLGGLLGGGNQGSTSSSSTTTTTSSISTVSNNNNNLNTLNLNTNNNRGDLTNQLSNIRFVNLGNERNTRNIRVDNSNDEVSINNFVDNRNINEVGFDEDLSNVNFDEVFNNVNQGIRNRKMPSQRDINIVIGSRDINRIKQVIDNLCFNGELDCDTVAPILQQIASQLRNYVNLYQFGNINTQSSLDTFRDQIDILRNQQKAGRIPGSTLNQQLTKATTRRNNLQKQQKKLEEQIVVLQQQIINLRRKNPGRVTASVRTTIDDINRQISTKADAIKKIIPQITKLTLQIRNLNLRITQVRTGATRDVQGQINSLETAIKGVENQSSRLINPNKVFSERFKQLTEPINRRRYQCEKLNNVNTEVDVGAGIQDLQASQNGEFSLNVPENNINGYLEKYYGDQVVQQADEVADLGLDRKGRRTKNITPIEVYGRPWIDDFGVSYNNLFLLANRYGDYFSDFLCQVAKQQAYKGYILGIDKNNLIIGGPNGQTYLVQIGACTNFDSLRGRSRPYIGDDVYFRARNHPRGGKDLYRASQVTCY